MFLISVLRYALFLLVPLSLTFTSYLYLYPAFHGCAFPSPEYDASEAYVNTLRQHTLPNLYDATKVAPFRLLALGDPQLEGESSIRDIDSVNLPNLKKFFEDSGIFSGMTHSPLQRVRHSLHDIIDFWLDDLPKAFEVYRKRFDHIGNDYYLGHIYRATHWWLDPTHVTVLGDLVGSQWIDDEEFEERGRRYWTRVFKHGERIPDEIMSPPAFDFQNAIMLGDDAAAWKKRIINVAGNHDVGYAGDISKDRVARFERVFGKANYELRFQLPSNHNSSSVSMSDIETDGRDIPEIRIMILNDMNLDTPVSDKDLQDESYQFLNDLISTSHAVERSALFTLVLTHIPLYKDGGICVDGPFFDFFDGEFENGVKEQNHLSRDASKGMLEGVFGMSGNAHVDGQGMGRHGIILTGHDHEGCDIYHYINQSLPEEDREWKCDRYPEAKHLVNQSGIPGLREVTVRSMMGDFAGNAGLLSLWFDKESWEWQFEFANCGLGTQHIWWFVHILDFITVIVSIVYGVWLAVFKACSILGLHKNGTKSRKKEKKVTFDIKPDTGIDSEKSRGGADSDNREVKGEANRSRK
ncbi:Bcted1 [Botrytis cinerea B05.10]|uniref:Bcted1 n=2 Tax=Botryotinia fuckeliana TaxID=40559 RepID=A0A384JIF8_BOTFB|nr:Bcted1 [Botrytis cinerea B05.10]ATZ50366.1 Bcted1 [Botrytis cinerea B05.10]EMR84093.1 putative polarized growth protein [Botrytis cinerea BcDW1]